MKASPSTGSELERVGHLAIGVPQGAVRIKRRHALAAGALPRRHEDPFDRLLVAQARLEGLTIATRDLRFEPYGVPTQAA